MSILKRLKRQEGIRNLYMDITEGDFPPQRGDYIQTVTRKKAPSHYHILIARAVHRRDSLAPRRYVLTTRKVTGIPKEITGRVFHFRWHKRLRRIT